jgi:hypothetical protein
MGGTYPFPLALVGLQWQRSVLEYSYVLKLWSIAVFTCKLMRSAVLVSAALLVMGVAMEVLAQTTSFAITANVVAIVAVLASPAVMLVAFVVGLLPARLTHLDECQH